MATIRILATVTLIALVAAIIAFSLDPAFAQTLDPASVPFLQEARRVRLPEQDLSPPVCLVASAIGFSGASAKQTEILPVSTSP